MNKLISAIKNRDTSAMASMMQKEPQMRVVNSDAEKMIDAIFKNLTQIFPAARQTTLITSEDIATAKRQWILAFAEAGITTADQVRAGMRVARQQESDFWPSCGKFIGWCKSGVAENFGFPTVDDAISEFYRFCASDERHSSPEVFPWSHDVMYWIVTDVHAAMYRYNYDDADIRRAINTQINRWLKKISSGEQIPKPRMQIENKARTLSIAEVIDKTGKYKKIGTDFISRICANKITGS